MAGNLYILSTYYMTGTGGFMYFISFKPYLRPHGRDYSHFTDEETKVQKK